jgi:hypothetical protein
MIDRKLLIALVLPLVILALVSTILVWPLKLVDVLTNLIVEIVGILITVIYVDWILRSREKEKWEQADSLIMADFAAYALRFVAESTLFLIDGGWHPPDVAKYDSPDKPWVLLVEHVSDEEIHTALVKVQPKNRESFASGLDQRLEDLLQLHARYSNRLSAEDTKLILELDGTLRSLQTELSLVDDETTLLDMANVSMKKVDLLRSEHMQRSAAKFHEAISYSIRMFGWIGFPRSGRALIYRKS